MEIRKAIIICASALFCALAGCAAPGAEKTSGSGNLTSANSLSSASQVLSSSPSSVVNSESASSEKTGSVRESSKIVSSAAAVESESSQSGSEWVAYDDKNHNLHIRRKDGTEDKIILKDIDLAPCVAGEWVYYLADLDTIEKVKLDGTHKTKVCSTQVMQNLNGNMAITSEYKNGYILYRTQQCHEVGNNSSYPANYYKLDPDTNKITEVKNQ